MLTNGIDKAILSAFTNFTFLRRRMIVKKIFSGIEIKIVLIITFIIIKFIQSIDKAVGSGSTP